MLLAAPKLLTERHGEPTWPHASRPARASTRPAGRGAAVPEAGPPLATSRGSLVEAVPLNLRPWCTGLIARGVQTI
jgi:hypothetical protein